MHLLTTVGLAEAAGLHAALCGAWKDSPHESFKPRSFFRELLIAAFVGAALSRVDGLTTPFLIYLSAFTLSRIATEFYKMFVRRERQDVYRIPTQIHWIGRVVDSPPLRLLLGCGWLGAIYGLYCLLKLLPHSMPPTLVGPIAGVAFGTALAIGGGYKDGSVTKFYLYKFVRSPITGAIGGLIVSLHAGGLRFFVLGAIACERMMTELFFKIMRPGYVGGHFMTADPLYPEWIRRRWMFGVPYAMTWILFVLLWIAGVHP
ncbi:MAG TPA: hypothetical protein VGY57_01185 [Vicinamibacterales bacterium]|nr:hypothetical protein [Vicinamibacterales bacterium]